MVVDLIRLRAALEAEILTLRQQINVLRRTAPKTQTFSAIESIDFCLPLSASPWRSRCAGDCQAGDRSQMASRWLPIILAMEIESAGWQANSSVGDTPAYPRDERCQSAVGSASDPWRAPQELGVDIGQTSVAKYMVRRCAGTAPHSERWIHSLPSDLGWFAPPVCPDLIYDRHTRTTLSRSSKVRSFLSWDIKVP